MSEQREGKATVLVADDNTDARSLLTFWLEQNGYHTLQAGDGQAADEIALRERPDLVLMDISMPHVDGFIAARRIHSHDELSSIPIVAITALIAQEVRSAALEAGCAEVIQKPIDYGYLSEVLDRLLRSSSRVAGEVGD